VKQCLKEMKWSTSHGRLFVSYGAPNNIPNRSTETSVSRALNGSGGIYGNELWLSEDETELVVEIRTLARADEGFEALRRNLAWYPVEDFIVYPSVSVFRVNNLLETGNRRADTVLIEYLRQKVRIVIIVMRRAYKTDEFYRFSAPIILNASLGKRPKYFQPFLQTVMSSTTIKASLTKLNWTRRAC